MEGHKMPPEDATNTAKNAGDSSNSDGKNKDEKQVEFKAPATQEELNTLIESRLSRERAKYTGFDEIKAKAEKYDELADKDKTEAQREKDRADRAENETEKLRGQLLRSDVARTTGVPAELLSGETEDELKASAEKLIAFRGKQEDAEDDKDKKKNRRPSSTSLERTDREVTKGDTASLFASFMQDNMNS